MICELLCGAILLGSAPVQGEEPSQEELRQRLEQRLESPWLGNAAWVTGLDEARNLAQERGTRIFAFFTRSKFECSICARLENGVLSSPDFARWVEDYVPYVHFATGLEGRKDEELFRELFVSGWPPQLAFLDADGNLLSRHQGEENLEAILKTDSRAAQLQRLRDKARQGDVAAAQQVFLTELALAQFTLEEGTRAFEAMSQDMPDSMRARGRQSLVDLEFQERRRHIQERFDAGMSAEDFNKQEVALYLDMFNGGKIPSGLDGLMMGVLVRREAEKTQDGDLYERANSLYEERLRDSREPPPATIEEREPDAVSAFAETVPGSLEVALVEGAHFLVTQQVPAEPQGEPCMWHYETGTHDEPEEHSHRLAVTAIVCEALMLTPGFEDRLEHMEAVQRSVDFLIRELTENPALQPASDDCSQSWAQAYALRFFLRASQHRGFDEETRSRFQPVISHLLNCLAENERGWPSGGWDYVNIDPTSPFMTGAILLVLYQAQSQGWDVPGETIDLACKGLSNTRLPKGTYLYSGGSSPAKLSLTFAPEYSTWAGSSARTPVAELALYLADRSDLRRLQTAVDSFFDHWGELKRIKDLGGKHRAPHGVAPYYFMFGNAYAAQAIEALPEEARPNLRHRLQQALWYTREPNGSWTERNDPNCSAYATAMAMMALMAPELGPTPAWKDRDR